MSLTAAMAFVLGAAQFAMGDAIINLAAGQDSSARIRDQTFGGNGTLVQSDQANQVGLLSFAAVHSAFVFEMDGIGDPSSIDTANFSVSLTSKSTANLPTWNVDVYANRVSSSNAFENADYENGTLIMEDFVVTTDSPGSYTLDSTGQANLSTFLQNNWVDGSFVFFSLKSDPIQTALVTGDPRYTFGGSSSSDAQLSVSTAVPEPSVLALAALGVLLLYRRARHII